LEDASVLNCKDASRLQSYAYERPLNARELIGLKLHLLICKGCRGFAQHLRLIHLACRRIDESKGVDADAPGLTPEAKTHILKELASKQSEKP
jgi:hypothetical protein